MDENQVFINKLQSRGIKPTANRILIIKAIEEASRAVSIHELEKIMYPMDKSSIFRTLNLFFKHHLVHAIEDGSGSLKYEICDGEDDCSIDDMHAHFYCESCHRTICLKSTLIPVIGLPEGFSMHSINYMVKGICDQCMRKKSCE